VTDEGTWLVGTRLALVAVGPEEVLRVPWEQVETADWDGDEQRLRVRETGEFGRVSPVHLFTVPDPGRLLPMVRERVTASVLLQRRVAVQGRRGVTVVARRSPSGTGPVVWAWEFDVGVDPAEPAVRTAAERALAAARDELGLPEDDAGPA
jgi:hypothetical protein